MSGTASAEDLAKALGERHRDERERFVERARVARVVFLEHEELVGRHGEGRQSMEQPRHRPYEAHRYAHEAHAAAHEPDAVAHIRTVIAALQGVPWEREAIHNALMAVVEKSGLGPNKIFMPVRLAVTGKKISPPIDYTLALQPKDVAMARLARVAGVPA